LTSLALIVILLCGAGLVGPRARLARGQRRFQEGEMTLPADTDKTAEDWAAEGLLAELQRHGLTLSTMAGTDPSRSGYHKAVEVVQQWVREGDAGDALDELCETYGRDLRLHRFEADGSGPASYVVIDDELAVLLTVAQQNGGQDLAIASGDTPMAAVNDATLVVAR
jgi:hypothetical protein